MGKYRFTVLPQGTSLSCDIFNIISDGGIRKVEGHLKNIDDILTTSSSVDQMEQRLRRLLGICQVKNIKLSPEKFNIGQEVTFGGLDLKEQKLKETQRERSTWPQLQEDWRNS